MNIAKTLKALRTERGINTRTLALKATVPQILIEQIEAGTYSPYFDTLERLCGGLNVPLLHFIALCDYNERFGVMKPYKELKPLLDKNDMAAFKAYQTKLKPKVHPATGKVI